MANTYVDYVGSDGTGTDGKEFAFSFPYIKTSHVAVEINQGPAGGTNKWERTTAFTVETSPSTRVVLDSTPNSLWRIRVLRDSDASTGIVDFANGSVLTETELDNAYEHNRYLAEEAEEGKTGGALVKNPDTGQFNADALRLENLADPDSDDDAVNKGYADDRYVDADGDTMRGPLNMGSNNITNVPKISGLVKTNITADADAASKEYVDDQDALQVTRSGDSMSGTLAMGGNSITGVNSVQGLVAPGGGDHAANKTYVDDTVDDEASARVAGDALKVNRSGDTMEGPLTLPDADPSNGNHATRKTYVDAQIAATLATGVAGGPIDTVNIADNAVETAKIADDAVTFAKLQNINSGTVIGRSKRDPADTGDPEEVTILDEDDMNSDSDTSLATQQSIKAYVDTAVSGVTGATDLGVTHNEETVTVTSSTGDDITLNAATASNSSTSTAGTAGVMTDGDKEKLDGIATGATANTGTVTEVSGSGGLTGTVSTTGSLSIATDGVTSDKISSTDNTFKVASGSVVINEGGADVDFRVEGSTNANLIVADAGADKVGIRGAIDATFPIYIHGDQAAGMGVTGNIQINRLAGAGIRYFTDNAANPNKTTDITTTTTGNIEFNKPDKTSNQTTHLFEANGDIETLTGSYGTLSDRNLKENVNYLNDEQKAGQVADIKNLKFAKYNLKGEGITQLGVIAQDVEQTSPGLVSKSIINGSEVRSVKQSIMHQKAVVALQVALEKIEDLEARIKVLESK